MRWPTNNLKFEIMAKIWAKTLCIPATDYSYMNFKAINVEQKTNGQFKSLLHYMRWNLHALEMLFKIVLNWAFLVTMFYQADCSHFHVWVVCVHALKNHFTIILQRYTIRDAKRHLNIFIAKVQQGFLVFSHCVMLFTVNSRPTTSHQLMLSLHTQQPPSQPSRAL